MSSIFHFTLVGRTLKDLIILVISISTSIALAQFSNSYYQRLLNTKQTCAQTTVNFQTPMKTSNEDNTTVSDTVELSAAACQDIQIN